MNYDLITYLFLCFVSGLACAIYWDSEYTKGMHGQDIFEDRDERLGWASLRFSLGFIFMPFTLMGFIGFCALCLISIPLRLVIK